jgi:CDP-4-dehydro-6-deoxyglucose reductase, E1
MIKLMKSSFYQEAKVKIDLIDFIAKAEIFSMGEQCALFEKKFAYKQGRKYGVFVANGSMANLLLIQALLNLGRLKQGDKVGVSSLTWSTNVMPIIQLGLVPVALDCNLDTLNVGPAELKKNIKDLKALFLTNALGFCDNIQELAQICREHDIIFLEDNCESLGSSVGGRLLGNFGMASTFSFFVGHHLSTIEGGMVCTDDEVLCDALVMSRAHGWDRNLSEEKQNILRNYHQVSQFYAKYTFYDLSFNARPSEINGFIGNKQIKYWDEIVSIRARNFHIFQQAILKNDDFIPLDVRHMDLVSNFAMPVICLNKEMADKYKNKFIRNSVEIRPVIAGDISRQPFYKKYAGSSAVCQNASLIHGQGFYFPNNPELTRQEMQSITALLTK